MFQSVLRRMSDTASKEAQEAYVNSLYRMTYEQLIAEVMRVQMAAADLIKQEVQAERNSCIAQLEELDKEVGVSMKDAIDSLLSRNESIQ